MNIIYFQPKNIRPQYCEVGVLDDKDPNTILYLDEPCKIKLSEVTIVPAENVFYDKKTKLYNVKQ